MGRRLRDFSQSEWHHVFNRGADRQDIVSGGRISEAMQRLCARYASAYNGRTEREGSVFTGRFKNVPVTSDGQLHAVARYIHRNPLAFVPPAALAAYRWSSLGALVGRRPVPSLVTLGPVTGGTEPTSSGCWRSRWRSRLARPRRSSWPNGTG